jgi:hypothetical protein
MALDEDVKQENHKQYSRGGKILARAPALGVVLLVKA